MQNWIAIDLKYYRYSTYIKEKFGSSVYGLSLDAGFTCPNIDGSKARGGCVYCNNNSFVPAKKIKKATITEQIDQQLPKVKQRYSIDKFFAYFQAATNTYAPIEKLEELWTEALSHENIIGLKVSTRPDCVSDEVLDLLAKFAKETYVVLELGLQTIHEKTSKWINRAHSTDEFYDAVERAHARGLPVCAHVILGLKDETFEDMMATADAIAKLNLHAVKVHNLQVTRHTALEYQYKKGEVILHDREEMLNLVARF